MGKQSKSWRVGGIVATVALIGATIAVGVVVVAAPGVHGDTEIHLTAAGDYGARATSESVLQKIVDLDPDADLAVGDFEYQDASPESAWCNFVKEKVGEGFPFELVSGNHESLDEADGLINNFSACLPNQVPGAVGTYGREYYLDFPRVTPLVRVISVTPGLLFEDGVWAYAPGDAHYTWLSNAIDDARAKGAKWVIVDADYPCLSVGIYNCVSGTGFFNLMMSKKVDLVIHGHEHAYMRTHQLRAGTTNCPTVTVGSYNAACVADNDSDFVAGQGTVFATVGTGGTPLRDINAADPEAPYFATYEGLNSNPTYGLLDLHISDTQLERAIHRDVGRALLGRVHDHQGRGAAQPAAGRGDDDVGPGPHRDRQRGRVHRRRQHRLVRLGVRRRVDRDRGEPRAGRVRGGRDLRRHPHGHRRRRTDEQHHEDDHRDRPAAGDHDRLRRVHPNRRERLGDRRHRRGVVRDDLLVLGQRHPGPRVLDRGWRAQCVSPRRLEQQHRRGCQLLEQQGRRGRRALREHGRPLHHRCR